MATPAPAPPTGAHLSIARLHGEACIACGAVNVPLAPDGTVTTEGRTWAVVACAAHRGVPR
jgi:hypothetical protein